MALPDSAPKVTCSLSKPLLAEGTEGSITTAFLRIDRDLVWETSGETLYKEAAPVAVQTADEIGTIKFDVVPVDVLGMRDSAGYAVTYWSYTLRVTLALPGGATRAVDYMFQPLLSQGDVDLDLVPHVDAELIPPVFELAIVDGGGA